MIMEKQKSTRCGSAGKALVKQNSRKNNRVWGRGKGNDLMLSRVRSHWLRNSFLSSNSATTVIYRTVGHDCTHRIALASAAFMHTVRGWIAQPLKNPLPYLSICLGRFFGRTVRIAVYDAVRHYRAAENCLAKPCAINLRIGQI